MKVKTCLSCSLYSMHICIIYKLGKHFFLCSVQFCLMLLLSFFLPKANTVCLQLTNRKTQTWLHGPPIQIKHGGGSEQSPSQSSLTRAENIIVHKETVQWAHCSQRESRMVCAGRVWGWWWGGLGGRVTTQSPSLLPVLFRPLLSSLGS